MSRDRTDKRSEGAPEAENSAAVDKALSKRRGGRRLKRRVRAQMESHLGADLSDVRVHCDADAEAAAEQLGARAFTYGADIYLGKGESDTDQELMAHELAHVVQQSGGTAQIQQKAEVEDSSSAAESEADAVADAAAGSEQKVLLVADSATELDDGQLKKSEFLARLRPQVTEAAGDALGGFWSVFDCPYIDRYLDHYASKTAEHIERAIKRFAPEAQTVTTAAALIPIVVARVRRGVHSWKATGELSADVARIAPSDDQQAARDSHGGADVIQRKPLPSSSPSSQGTDGGVSPVSNLGEGQALDAGAASRIGGAMGTELSDVRVHTDSAASEQAAGESARAFTVGQHIVFGAGEYKPNTPEGDALIAHEAAHAVQQRGAEQSRQPPKENASPAHEQDADRSAKGVLARLYGGVKKVAKNIGPALTSGFSLQRCGDGPTRVTTTDAFILALEAKLDAGDKPGYFSDLSGLAMSRAGDSELRAFFSQWQGDGKLTTGDAFRSVALTELGPQRDWPEVVENFAEGADSGAFSPSALAPAGPDALREFCVLEAGNAADGTGDLSASYRNQFNAKWDIAPYASMAGDFDNTLDSRGPHNARARAIFDALMADPVLENAYDTDTPAGFRAVCDTHQMPDGINLLASPRLAQLRNTLGFPPVTAASTADSVFTTLAGIVRAKAQLLDAKDREAIADSHQWRLAVDEKVRGPNDAVTRELRAELWDVVRNSRAPVAPAGPAPAPAPAPVVEAEPAPTLNAGQRTFLRGITITAPPSPQVAQTTEHSLDFTIHSANPNPGLDVRRRIVIEPSDQVVFGDEDESDWAHGDTNADHTAEVNPDAGGSPTTTFTARLTMPPVPTSDFAEKTATVTVEDKRQDWFVNNIDEGVTMVNENDYSRVNTGGVVAFKGGQIPIRIAPNLPAPNPGLRVELDGQLSRSGAVIQTFSRTDFPNARMRVALYDTILQVASPAASAAEPMELSLSYYVEGAGAAFHTTAMPFFLDPEPALPAGRDAAVMAADNATLNQPIGTAGSLLDTMANSTNSTQQAVARAVDSGALKVRACFVRSDSRDVVVAEGEDPASKVAYAMGVVDPPGTVSNTLIGAPGAAGWRWSAQLDTVYLNLTDRAGHQRSIAAMAEFLAHEGIHAADRAPGLFGRYETEFRAYWIMGVGAAESTAPDPTMSGIGPKTPRARVIFEHMYGSSTYPFVKPNYDDNVDGFRVQVDNLLYPDGINLTLSGDLAELRRVIEGYSGSGYSGVKASVTTKYAALSADDKREVANNRAWRDLVEEKFTGTVIVWELPPRLEEEVDQIKRILHIPL